MSFLKNSNGVVLALVVFSFLLAAPVIAAEGAVETNDAAGDKAAAEKAAAEKAKAEKIALTPLVVKGVIPFVEEKEKGDIEKGLPGYARMGDRINVVVPGLSEAITYKVKDPSKLALFIDGRAFKDVYPESVGWDSVVYKLERTPEAMNAWNSLLGRPQLNPVKEVMVSVGYADQQPFKVADDKRNLKLIVYRDKWAWGSLAFLIVILLLFWKYGRENLLRDSAPPDPAAGKHRPYSLAKVQVAWWFFIVIGSFLLIYLITGELTMSEQALILMGIGTGTALGAGMIDSSKRKNADTELETLRPQQARLKAEIELLDEQIAEVQTAIATNTAASDAEKAALQTARDSLAARRIERAEKNEKLEALELQIADARAGLQNPTSKGPWSDLVTDADGPSFHRFQMIVWTVILGALFLAGVYKNLAMPEFSGTLLALLGISAGTYLGFKVPERQTKGDEPGANGSSAAGAARSATATETIDKLDGHDTNRQD